MKTRRPKQGSGTYRLGRFANGDVNWVEWHQTKRAALSVRYGGFDEDVMKVFYELSSDQFDQLMAVYAMNHSASAASYARGAYPDWKSAKKKPAVDTIERIIVSLPQVLSFTVKCDLLRRLRERHRTRERHHLTVDTSNWMDSVAPFVRQLVAKAYMSDIPERVYKRLEWLSTGDMQAAESILAEAEAQASRNAVTFLREEINNIEALLASTKGNTKVTHTIKLLYGEIELELRRRSKWAMILNR